MATHYSILAWRIPWTEEPGGLQPIGSQRVGHDWRDLAHTPLLCRLIGSFGVPVSLAHPLQHAYLVPGLSPGPLLARQKFQSIRDFMLPCTQHAEHRSPPPTTRQPFWYPDKVGRHQTSCYSVCSVSERWAYRLFKYMQLYFILNCQGSFLNVVINEKSN